LVMSAIADMMEIRRTGPMIQFAGPAERFI
jgi:hypothetical protein